MERLYTTIEDLGRIRQNTDGLHRKTLVLKKFLGPSSRVKLYSKLMEYVCKLGEARLIKNANDCATNLDLIDRYFFFRTNWMRHVCLITSVMFDDRSGSCDPDLLANKQIDGL